MEVHMTVLLCTSTDIKVKINVQCYEGRRFHPTYLSWCTLLNWCNCVQMYENGEIALLFCHFLLSFFPQSSFTVQFHKYSYHPSEQMTNFCAGVAQGKQKLLKMASSSKPEILLCYLTCIPHCSGKFPKICSETHLSKYAWLLSVTWD